MKYGCIGEHLGHSFSREIHGRLAEYEYELCEIAPEALDDFARARKFKAINVTIPYKEKIMPHLYKIDEGARLIGAVNTVVNRGGELYGYNTDFYGMIYMLNSAGIVLKDKTVMILGTGGTGRTAVAVSRHLGAKKIVTVSRNGEVNYQNYLLVKDVIAFPALL